jgi:3-oxo-5alpha-steroid 4-dehydrogenase
MTPFLVANEGGSPVMAPAQTSNEQSEFDVVVVGFGAEGACAAIAAAEHGARVLVVDRALGGGSSALSGGVVYAGGGTPYQQTAGYPDTPQNMFNYLRQEVNGAVDDDTLHRFCDESVHIPGGGYRFSQTLLERFTSRKQRIMIMADSTEKMYGNRLVTLN